MRRRYGLAVWLLLLQAALVGVLLWTVDRLDAPRPAEGQRDASDRGKGARLLEETDRPEAAPETVASREPDAIRPDGVDRSGEVASFESERREPRRTPEVEPGAAGGTGTRPSDDQPRDEAQAGALPAPPKGAFDSGSDGSFSSFHIRKVTRGNFPLAQTLKRSRRTPARDRTLGTATGSSASVRATPWDAITIEASQLRSEAALGRTAVNSRWGLEAMRHVSFGRLAVESKVAQRDGRPTILQGNLRADTYGGLSAGVGDENAPAAGAGLHGTAVRGVRIERRATLDGKREVAVGILSGRAAGTWLNNEEGRRPRSLHKAFARVTASDRLSLAAEVFRVADRDALETVRGSRLDHARGYALSASHQGSGTTAAAVLSGSEMEYASGDIESGSEVSLRGSQSIGPLAASAAIRSVFGGGIVAHPGPLGALQTSPRRVASSDLSFRGGRSWSLGMWGGAWEQPVRDLRESDDEPEAPPPAGRADGGRHWGARASWKGIPRTGLQFSREVRRREVSQQVRETTTLSATATEQLHPNAQLTVRWNRMTEEHRAPHNYLSGGISVRLGSGAVASVQQRTVWQEPRGAQFLTVAEVSSVPAGPLRAGLQVAQIAERGPERFRPVQRQGVLSATLRLGARAKLVGRYQVRRILGGRGVDGLELRLTHTCGGGDRATGGDAAEPARFARQLIKGCVFEDRNGDGIQQADEPGISEVGVAINGDVREPILTDVQGRYRSLLPPGRHLVRILAESVPTVYALDALGPHEFEIRVDQPAQVDFPITRQIGSIEGRVLREDPSGISEATGAANVKVVLNGMDFTWTDAEGRFRFRGLPAGDHVVRLAPSSIPFGFQVRAGLERRVQVAAREDQTPLCEFVLARPVRRTEF